MRYVQKAIVVALAAVLAGCAKKTSGDNKSSLSPAVVAGSGAPESPPGTPGTPPGEPSVAGPGSDGATAEPPAPGTPAPLENVQGSAGIQIFNSKFPKLTVETVFESADPGDLAKLGIDPSQTGQSIRARVVDRGVESGDGDEVVTRQLRESPASVVVHVPDQGPENNGREVVGYVVNSPRDGLKILTVADLTVVPNESGKAETFSFQFREANFTLTPIYKPESGRSVRLPEKKYRYFAPPHPIEALSAGHGATSGTVSLSWEFVGGPASTVLVLLHSGPKGEESTTCTAEGALSSKSVDPVEESTSIPLPSSVSSPGTLLHFDVCAVNESGMSASRSVDYTVGNSNGYFGILLTTNEAPKRRIQYFESPYATDLGELNWSGSTVATPELDDGGDGAAAIATLSLGKDPLVSFVDVATGIEYLPGDCPIDSTVQGLTTTTRTDFMIAQRSTAGEWTSRSVGCRQSANIGDWPITSAAFDAEHAVIAGREFMFALLSNNDWRIRPWQETPGGYVVPFELDGVSYSGEGSKLHIFDAWGGLVLSSSNEGASWDFEQYSVCPLPFPNGPDGLSGTTVGETHHLLFRAADCIRNLPAANEFGSLHYFHSVKGSVGYELTSLGYFPVNIPTMRVAFAVDASGPVFFGPIYPSPDDQNVELRVLRLSQREDDGSLKRLPVLTADGTPLVRATGVRDLIARFDVVGNIHLFFLKDDAASPQITRLVHAVGRGDSLTFQYELIGPPFPALTRLNQALIKNL